MNLFDITKTFDSVADLLAASREYIENHGWCQGHYQLPDGSVCSLGSLPAAMGLSWYAFHTKASSRQKTMVRDAERALMKAIGIRSSHSTIPAWNDFGERTEQEVLDIFAKAEKIERAGFDPDKGIEV